MHYVMKTTILHWSSIATASFSAVWILLLTVLVVRCRLAEQPFPVLAKFSPFRGNLVATDWALNAFPVLVLLGLTLLGKEWFRERSFRAVRPVAIAIGVSVLLSALVIALNPGGYVSWFLS
jgi:hypothetical protein